MSIKREINEVQNEIKAIKLILNSFVMHENSEEERKKYLIKNFDEFPAVRTYFYYSVDRLPQILDQLQEKELVLLKKETAQPGDGASEARGVDPNRLQKQFNEELRGLATRHLSVQDLPPRAHLYGKVAKAVQSSERLTAIVQDIRAFYYENWITSEEDNEKPREHFVVCAPSGTGKTQLGFDLQLQSELDVLHVRLFPGTESMIQPIYSLPMMLVASSTLLRAVKWDMTNNTELSATNLLIGDVLGGPYLRTVQWLSVAFALYDESARAFNTVNEFRKALLLRVKYSSNPKLPVLVVDEAWPNSQDSTKISQLLALRTILRAAGVAVIYMGTSIKMANFVRRLPCSDGSRGSKDAYVDWAKCICSLPYATLLPDQQNLSLPCAAATTSTSLLLRNFLAAFIQQVQNRRAYSWNPHLFHILWEQYTADNEVSLDKALADAAKQLYATKHLLRSVGGLRGQIQYFLGNELGGTGGGVLVNAHYAQYDRNYVLKLKPTIDPSDRVSLMLVEDSDTADAQQSEQRAKRRKCTQTLVCDDVEPDETVHSFEWSPTPVFAPLTQDPLLPLFLGGCCCPSAANADHPVPFQYNETPLTSAAAFMLMKCRKEALLRREGINAENSAVSARNGVDLQAMGALAVVCASQSCGMGGCHSADFLLALVRELQAEVMPALGWSVEGLQLQELWDTEGIQLRIPVLARVSNPEQLEEYPSELLLHAGCAQRPPNSAQVDMIVSTSFLVPPVIPHGTGSGRSAAAAELHSEQIGKIKKSGKKSSRGRRKKAAADITESDISELPVRAGSAGVTLSTFTVEFKNRKGAADAGLLTCVRDKFRAHQCPLGIVVVSKLATLQTSLDTAEVNVVQLRVVENTIHITRLGPNMDVAPVVTKPYLLCVILCDEQDIRQRLQQSMGRIYQIFTNVTVSQHT